MLYKQVRSKIMRVQNWLMIVLCFFSYSANATSIHDYLRQKMLTSYDNLNVKIEQCRHKRAKVAKDDIKSAWLSSLSREKKVMVVSILSEMANDQCVAEEKARYSQDLLNYVAETGDKTRLDEWLKIQKTYRPQALESEFQQLDMQRIEKLSAQPPFNAPFNPLQLMSVYQ
ncbi:hypothetical protein VR7878_02668 [Vibrio ruber DSM 16370]|uniref:Lysozyme inhibitor LprI N-terminal domain-containing protein n=1 Tax=Vibrio ruber (strain DSM 16370 / JCM 11486 / BCRC 17186 / CECT 7878 / LMG 23124 / VR1) TaxID=1123498 RepID=A0A1R4LNG2_VIBR1|nr:hypothetical protein [Vibrio ruber]SJN58132.1 hypothetical protein VR7878_02668 [Vibrio ruber DSM 16370]